MTILRVLAAVAVSTVAIANETPRAPPAFRLGDAAAPVSYDVRLAIDPRETEFSGEVRIALRFNRATPVLWLNATNLRIESAAFEQGERKIAVEILPGGEDFVGFEAKGEAFSPGDALATLRYRGSFDGAASRGLFRQPERGDWYVISQFEAISARRALPCFDEPGWKTPWRLTIDAPASERVVSNTPETSAADVPERAGWKRHAFKETPPLPSYLIALAVGPFDVVDGGTAGANRTPLRYFAPRGRGAEVRYAKESTPRFLEILEDYFGSPYPFEKLDSVSVPQVPFGAMENVGMITYGSTLLLATPHEETARFQRSYARLAAHEVAHMWFGNLVTLAWWDDIWLNEAFASWMEEKVLQRYRPEWSDGFRQNLSRTNAIKADRLASARTIANPVRVKGDIVGAFDSITYDKGAEVLSMFEGWFTPQKFREGVRLFLKRHAWGTATSQDFFRALGEASGREERALAIFNAFIAQPGVPLVDVALDCGARRPGLSVSQQRLRPAGSTAAEMQWVTPVCFSYSSQGRPGSVCREVSNGGQRVELSGLPACPDWVVGNAAGGGHYVVRYDAALVKRLATQVQTVPGPEALAMLTNATLLAVAGLMPADQALALGGAAIGHASPAVQLNAVQLLIDLRDEWLAPGSLRLKREIMGRRVEPLARNLGWREVRGDSATLSSLRAALLPFVAEGDRSSRHRSEASQLALRWVADRQSIPANLAPPVLNTAGRFADAALYAKIEAAMLASQDRRERNNLLFALAKVRDEKLRARAFSLALHKDLSSVDALNLLEEALKDNANRRAAFDYVRANFEPLVAKLPQHSPGRLMTPLGSLCTPRDRADFADFFRERASRFLGGELRYAQALESIDLCIAARRLVSGTTF
jgi:alanyl aminopeptidase